jgi:hypothetical protein
MAKLSNQQSALKPQDLYVLFALLVGNDQGGSYPALAAQTGLVPSAVHAALKRATLSGLLIFRDRQPMVLKPQLREFVLHGAKYAFPAIRGTLTRGVPTAYAAPPLNSTIAPSSDPVPVWPYTHGTIRGVSLAPLYPSVADAATRDKKLYEVLSLFDALRAGQARERDAARKLLEEYFK